MNPNLTQRVEHSCRDLLTTGEQITFPAVAQRSGIREYPQTVETSVERILLC